MTADPRFSTPFRKPINYSAWYWIVAGSTTQVYFSAAVAYVAVSDATYVAWLAVPGNIPAQIAVEQDLWDLLYSRGIALPAGAVASDAEKTRLLNGANLITLKILFNHENRIRTLNSQANLTFVQFLAIIKNTML